MGSLNTRLLSRGTPQEAPTLILALQSPQAAAAPQARQGVSWKHCTRPHNPNVTDPRPVADGVSKLEQPRQRQLDQRLLVAARGLVN